ncbi:2-C-methyl-D-erythritol 2,4-cyclodiphosphate synthase, putative [Babesia bigemina]|uniref:2-C-methyl-D-erythritol 2,4-cyclodiphosphate synthase n=1 Tax=Babesia bigemina TaxID=5866 RepID=A0A061DAU5_BABBI|nr:2-C-methyl-D-erythritol 2,4-cyclodiphosphate synthase, putative [Babesia bigemina]CDR96044.1 2-C-methyl-D-erythritol 2,4-cyclodiphosphate synthase, putative [Babesia bigemina]|eukprot:XP_012768230.1 2-C-methyl-D-erythritol 2,4-cyclodiphosphate synthase, putative [Babesia bigemina]
MAAGTLSHIIAIIIFYLGASPSSFAFHIRASQGLYVNPIRNLPALASQGVSDASRLASQYRVGLGYDVHRLVGPNNGGKAFKLGGIDVEGSGVFVVGHSDGDAVLHAIADAVLGAVGRGDIGEHFSDLDAANGNLDSGVIVRFALSEARNLGYRPCNVDVNIVLQRPRLGSELKRRITARVGELLGPGVCVNVKAKTNEGLDALGRGEAVACQSVVLLERV